MSYRAICDLCRNDFPGDASMATLLIPERHPAAHQSTMRQLDSWLGRPVQPVRELHVCVPCVDRLLTFAREHQRTLAGHTYGVGR